MSAPDSYGSSPPGLLPAAPHDLRVAEQWPVDITFVAESAAFERDARAYDEIWAKDGSKILQELERLSGYGFPETGVLTAIVSASVSAAGSATEPMRLRANYAPSTKKATLIHELGHRHLARLGELPESLDSHKALFLILYDVWAQLYGRKFAEQQVGVECVRHGNYDYRSAWAWALDMSREQRQAIFAALLTR